ncbi:Ubiquitin carboxyl-terminal hydrolase 32 [Phytophthora pseudosyringae]|uniref:ubiquitinyl hydrolase 1 n=1 Tax=Phytophthora pseudosyringae TaxID=221518 RepID=A0A8T1W9P0_9STRA|nr:Ubiquitin carboxyl-terminal hydrolase 32 [Phytophthora pseudosyringae]
MENSPTESPAPPPATPTLRKTASLPSYDLALRRDDDPSDAANRSSSGDDDTNSARVASIAEEEDVVSLSSASELSLRGTNGDAAGSASISAPDAPTPLDGAMSPSPSSTTSSASAIDRAANDIPGVTTERQEGASATSPKAEGKDTVPQLPKVGSAYAAPTLERSHTSSELIGLRTRERLAAESAYSSPSSGSAPSFEIESVTLPTDGVTEADIDKTTHTVFSVEVKLQGGLQWLIRKRYSDFRELHERLKRTSSPVKQLYFPKRHVFRNRHQSVVEQRRSELEKYINEVLDIRPLIRVPLFNFLEVYAHMESYERKLQRHKKELESERMKNMLPPELLGDFSTAFKRLCSSKYLYHGNTSGGHKTEAESSRSATSSSAPTSSGAPSGRPPTSPVKDVTTTTPSASAVEPSKGSTTDERGNRHSVIMHTAGSQICISRASFRRDILGVFPDMPSSFAMRFMKAVSDRQGSDINMDEFLRAVAILRCGTMEDQLHFIFNMCDLDHAGKVQSTGLSNFLVSLHGRHVLDRPEYRRLLSEGFDQGRVRMGSDDFIKIVPELKAYHTLVDWMAPFADILCETADPQLLESQEEFNPAVQEKILANETHFNAKEVAVLQDAFNNYRASGGGDAVDVDALTSDFPLEMSEERFCRVFTNFGSRANGSDIDVFSFVSALSIACRGTTKEKAAFAFKLFASVEDGSYMTREDIYGMLRLDITQNPELESQITALIEKKHPALNATKSASSSSLIESMGVRTPSVSGSELGIFVDGIMKGFGKRRRVWDASSSSAQTEALMLTLEEFTTWAIKQKYEMATLRIMREVAFIDLGLVPATKEEELLIATGCYTPYEPATLVEDDRWYLLERKWYIHWCRYIKIHVKESLLLSPPVTKPTTTAISTPSTSKVQVNSGSTANKDNYMKNLKGEIVRPKCINNYPLLTSDRRDRILKTSDDIKLGRHYVIICEQLWMALKLWYGGGPEIQRQVIVASDGEPMVDIWESETKKKLPKKKSKGKENDTDVIEEEDGDDVEDDVSSVPSEEESRRKQELALPRRMRSGGSVGLANLGNTCYMNSALQCLTNTKLLAEYFLSGMYLEDINRTSTLGLQGKLAEVYGKLAEDMWCVKQKSISPRNFKKSIGKFNEVFRGNDQQDAQELLAFLLSGLSEDLNRIQDKPYIEQPDSDGRYDADLADEWWRNHLRREVSIVVALFTGQYKSLLTCSVCGFKSARFEPFTFLQVPLPEPKHNTVTVQLMLANGVTPMKVSVRLSISATIFDLKHELKKMCHDEFDLPDVSESDIKLCEFSGSMILSFKADNRRVGQIRSIDRLIAFQLEPLDSETIQATRHRRPSYVQAVGAGGLRPDEADHSAFYETLAKGVLVDVRMRTQSHEYIPAVILEPPTAHVDYEDQPIVLVRLRRTEDEIKVPLNRLRPRQARLLYIPLLSRKLSYSAVYFKNPFRPVPFGSPNLVRLCPEFTSGLQLYQLVWERVKQYVSPSATPPTEWEEDDARNADRLVANHIDSVFAGLNDVSVSFSSKCGFLLRRVENKGLTDSRSSWLTRSFGFTIPCTSEPLDILEEEAIAVDWDLSVFQDREMMDKMKHVENHDSVARNEAIDKGPVPLKHCLDAFTSEEKISEGFCSSCRQHQEMTKKLEIWRLPPVMVVHLKRFQYTQTYRRKLASLVEFPIHDLDLSCCVAPHIEIPEKYPMKRPKSTASGVSAPARKLIKLRSRGGSTVSNGSSAPASHGAAEEAAAGSDMDKHTEHPVESEEDAEDSDLPAKSAQGASADGESSSPDAKGGSTTTTDTEATSTATTESQRAAAVQAAAGRNRVRRGYTNSNLDQSRCLETKYNLYGVVNHQGALGGGHYTAYAKNFVDDQWYYYDDERVRVVEDQQVVSPSAYLLFYLRSDMEDVLVKDLFPKNMKPGKITDEDIERFVEEGDERRCSIM